MTNRLNRRQFGGGALAASTAVAMGGVRPAAAAPVKIRVGWVVVPASSAMLVLEKKDLLKHFGQSYVAEAIHFEGTPPVITALAAGELEVGPASAINTATATACPISKRCKVICGSRKKSTCCGRISTSTSTRT